MTEVIQTDVICASFSGASVASTSASCVGLQLASVKSTSALFGYAKSTEVAHTEAARIVTAIHPATSGRASSS